MDQKKPYKKPILTKHADFVDITLGGVSSAFDFESKQP